MNITYWVRVHFHKGAYGTVDLIEQNGIERLRDAQEIAERFITTGLLQNRTIRRIEIIAEEN